MSVDSTRRGFIKAGAAGLTLLGFSLEKAHAEARELKISRTTETRSTCPYCSVSCGVIIHTEGDKSRNAKPFVVHVEGDADHPINQGSLCPKGITLKHDIVNERRLTKVLYRAPGAAEFIEKDWGFAIDRIAHLVKESRDKNLIEKDSQGRTVNALTSVAVVGGCTDSNENNYLLVKAFRAGLGVIPLEQQARI
jgi:formate dehydrogenase major subunit